MILKLRTGIKDNTGWKIIDNISIIDYKYIEEPENFDTSEQNNHYINNFPQVEDKRIVEINIYYKNQAEAKMYTDDMVYILNDEGKTCDTINF